MQVKELILCSAIIMPDGYIVRGHRHNDCIRTASGIEKYKGEKDMIQGFLTSRGRFVVREEAYKIHFGKEGKLFSEDLY